MIKNIARRHGLSSLPIRRCVNVNFLHGNKPISCLNDLHSLSGARKIFPTSPRRNGSFLGAKEFRAEQIAALFNEIGE